MKVAKLTDRVFEGKVLRRRRVPHSQQMLSCTCVMASRRCPGGSMVRSLLRGGRFMCWRQTRGPASTAITADEALRGSDAQPHHLQGERFTERKSTFQVMQGLLCLLPCLLRACLLRQSSCRQPSAWPALLRPCAAIHAHHIQRDCNCKMLQSVMSGRAGTATCRYLMACSKLRMDTLSSGASGRSQNASCRCQFCW